MKRVLLSVLVVLFVSGTALAAPMTWVDTVNFSPDRYVGWFDSTAYSHDITDDGFTPFEDIALNYTLNIALYDDGGFMDFGEIAFINQPGIFGDGFYNFSYSNQNFGWSLAGLLSVNLTGGLDVTISSSYGDFYLDYSTLTVNGEDFAPVPEPGTFILLGAGIAGLAFYRRKRS